MNTNRGSITKIEFDIEYPTGVKKHVTFSDDPSDAIHNHYILSEITGVFFGQDGLIDSISQIPKSVEANKVYEEWNSIKDGDSYQPAMVVFKKDGSTSVMCGGHSNGPHPVRAADDALVTTAK
jgi:hypothetical protein